MENDFRPDPDEILANIKKEEAKKKLGKLKMYFGMSAGVGKTFAMLQDAQKEYKEGVDIVVGYIETHRRPETEALLEGLPIIPRKQVIYNNVKLEEMDIDAIIKRKPKAVLVDELAHTNVPGSRHTKRYLDVEELINLGIDVYTTLNVQHLETRADAVQQISGIVVRETVPDSILDAADEIELIDISPDELLERLAEGKVYKGDQSKEAILNFFKKGNLTALREMSLRITADRVDKQLREYMKEKNIPGPWKSGQRIMAAITSSSYSANLIRWVRRTAYTMGASWIVLYVETSRNLTLQEKTMLKKNFDLARELGASVLTTSDEDVVNAIIRTAKKENISQIFVGKPRKFKFFASLFKDKIIERLIHESGNIDVHVVGGEIEQAEKQNIFKFLKAQSKPMKYFSTTFIVILVALICAPFDHFLGYQTISYIFLLMVALLPLAFGPGPVILAAGLSAVIWDYFFIPPKYTIVIGKIEDILMFAMYFIIALVSSILNTKIRAREKAIRQREERLSALYNLVNDLSSAQSLDTVINSSVENISKVFNVETTILLADSRNILFNTYVHESSLTLDQKEFSVASWVYTNGKKAGRFTETLPSALAQYYPLSTPHKVYGVAAVKFKEDEVLEIDQESLLENFIREIAVAIEREVLNETAKRSLIIEESEKLYKNLFNSISHELRTPLSTILGSVSYLVEEKNNLSKTDLELLNEIQIASDRLNRLVGNLLDMTRLERGRMELNLNWCDVHDLIGSTLKQLDRELKYHKIEINISPDMPFIKIDFILMEQVLKNILYNASLYTPHGTLIKILTKYDEGNCYIVVSDDGPGISEEHLGHIFDKFYRAENKSSGGIGLGLSIAKGFVEAHGGELSVESQVTGGTTFTIRLRKEKNIPIKDQTIEQINES
jgi:two-component system, OmpR family, sensor histidine kinase KdpD